MEPTVFEWLRQRRRALNALVAREVLTRYGRHNIGFLWLVIEPALFAIAIAALWSAIRGPTNPAMSVAGFALTGYATVLLWRNAAGRCTTAVSTNWALLYHACIDPVDLYLARIVIELLSATAGFAVIGAVMIALGYVQPVHDVVGLLCAWGAMMLFACGFALFIGAIAHLSESFERMWHMIAYLLFPISGPAYMVEWLPDWAREWALWIPMVHGTEWIRGAWFGPSLSTHEDPAYLLGASAVLIVIGLALVRKRGRIIEVAA